MKINHFKKIFELVIKKSRNLVMVFSWSYRGLSYNGFTVFYGGENFIAFEYHKRKGTRKRTERLSNIRHSFTQNGSVGRQKVTKVTLSE